MILGLVPIGDDRLQTRAIVGRNNRTKQLCHGWAMAQSSSCVNHRRMTGPPRLLRPALGTIRALPTRRRQWPEGTMEAALSSRAPKPPPHSGSCCLGEEGNARERTLAVPLAGEKPPGSGLARRGSLSSQVAFVPRLRSLLTPSPSPSSSCAGCQCGGAGWRRHRPGYPRLDPAVRH
jgi:hypothetical protein